MLGKHQKKKFAAGDFSAKSRGYPLEPKIPSHGYPEDFLSHFFRSRRRTKARIDSIFKKKSDEKKLELTQFSKNSIVHPGCILRNEITPRLRIFLCLACSSLGKRQLALGDGDATRAATVIPRFEANTSSGLNSVLSFRAMLGTERSLLRAQGGS